MKQSDEGKRDRRQQQLIQATIRCISQYGLAGTTVARVTRQANLSAGIVNFYFRGKSELLLDTLAYLHSEYCAALDTVFAAPQPAIDCLHQLIELHFDPELCHPDKIAVWYAFSANRAARAEYLTLCGEQQQRLQLGLTGLFEQLCQTEGRDQYAADALARGFDGLLDHLWEQLLYQTDAFDYQAAKTICRRYLQSLFPLQSAQPAEQPPTRRLNGNLQRSDLLAPWTYRNPELFELEVDTLFKRQWLLAGHVSDLDAPLRYITFDALGEHVFILRAEDGHIRAFHNVCRHRGGRLLNLPRGACPRRLTCPFHGWTYQTDGKLVGVPAKSTFNRLQLQQHALVPVDLDIWMGLIFIRLSGDAAPVSTTMQPINHLLEPYAIEQMQPLANSAYRELRNCNWKVFHDVDNEGYHIPVGHPTLQQLYGTDARDDLIDGIPVSYVPFNPNPATSWSVRHYQKLLPEYPHLPAANRRAWLYVGIFPSMVLGLYPDSIEYYMTLPESVDRTHCLGAAFALEDSRRAARAARYLSDRINRITGVEDQSFVDALQQGLSSSARPTPRLSSIEAGVRQFHHDIQAHIPVAGLSEPPQPGSVAELNRMLA